jgi:hypothetical protein
MRYGKGGRYSVLRRRGRRHPGGDLDPVVYGELVHDPFNVALDGALGDHETVSDLAIREAIRYQRRDLSLPPSEQLRGASS